ncbi:guanine nucleotide-binding protein subunit alpha-14-like isoform X1 [Cherax quadricarinatus]|uniref:guanine nucleotide-binding protein subunit alpha-14 isoform X1 n=1 Tax=Cherax quadricarinatus TaxID=27406 RepID=UPI00387E457A
MESDNDGNESNAGHRRSVLSRIWQVILNVLWRLRSCTIFESHEHGSSLIFRAPVQEARVLVLGASDTGKSTFLKQMRLVFGRGYAIDDCRRHQPHIRHNLLESLNKIVNAMSTFGVLQATHEAQDAAQRFANMELLKEYLQEDAQIDPCLVEQIRVLWEDPGVQEVYLRGNEYHLMTNAQYFITSAERILDENYVPNIEDILRMRFPTKGSFTSTYDLGDLRITMHDMGGQRPERTMWVNQQHPTTILLLASLSEYDQRVEEATEDKNRVQESLDIFEELLQYPPFEATPVILLLNKTDIFHWKIQHHSIKDFLPNYKGSENDECQGREFIAGLYRDVAVRHGRHFVVRFSEATNTDNFRAIFSFIRTNVTRNIMSRGGLF